MIPPSKLPRQTAVSPPKYNQPAIYFSIITAVTISALLIVSRILLIRQGEESIFGILSPIIIVGVWINAWFVWRGKVVLGTSLFALIFFFGTGFYITQRDGLGIAMTIDIVFIVVALFSYAWPRRWLTLGVSAVTVAGVVLILADLYWPAQRLPAPETLQPILLVSTAFIVTAVLILVVRQFADFTLREKLTLLFLTVTLIPLTLLATLNNQFTRDTLIDDANKILLSSALQMAASLDDFFSNNLDNIRVEANILGTAYDWAYYRQLPAEDRSSLGALGEAKAIELLKTYRNKDPLNIVSYTLLDMNGQIMFSYPPSKYNPDESKQSYFQTVIETGRPFASPVVFSPEDGEAYFYFSTLVFDSDGERFGVLRSQYKATVLQALVTRSTGRAGGNSFAVLFDENNIHLAHGAAPDAVFKLAASLSPNELAALQTAQRLPNLPSDELSTDLPELDASLRDALTQPFFTATDIATGKQINQVAVVSMNEKPWLVAFFQPQETFLLPIQTQVRRSVLLVLFIAGVVAAAAVNVAKLIAQPIVRLESVANLVAAGDLTVQAQVESEDEVGALAQTFNLMTAQIRDSIATLEQRVAERTQALAASAAALETTAEVSRRLSTILDEQQLVTAVVEEVQNAFNYYHAHIYLIDKIDDTLLMAGGTGEAGQQMLAQGHRIAVGKGLVGRVAQNKATLLVPDVTQDGTWLPNPLLPHTKAEAAVPIIYGGDLLGVLDVQHNVLDGLQQVDVDLLESLAAQVAIALQNARSYQQAQHRADQEARFNEINRNIQSTTDVETAMQVAIRELGRVLETKQVRVQLHSGQNGRNHEGKI